MNNQPHSVKDPDNIRKPSSGELLEEAKRQSQALRMIGRWRTIGFVVSAVGAVLLYSGVTGTSGRFPLIAAGAVIAAAGLAAAVLCDLGIRNGRRNVEKILEAAQRSDI